MIQIGTIIDDRYEILKEIGRGGMSVVYLAMDNRLNKSLVVKDIRKRANSNNELLINSLVVEANMLKRLDHGALPRIYDIIDSAGDIYVVMDYIEGESLKEKLKREGKIAADEVIDWARQLSHVLGYLHSRKPNPIIYRDMKPDNVMLTPEGKIKLIDFGIAREYKTDTSSDTTNLGTKGYAAPEQLSGKQTDARTDIYSLGVTLYHLVTGKSLSEPPYEVKPIRQWDPALPEGLEHIINKCTQSEPGDRYQTCEELAYDLENIDRLTQGYKNRLMKQLTLFLIPAVMFLGFSTTSVLGYKGMKNEQFQDYMGLVNQSSLALIEGKETEAAELLERAITVVDNKRPEAYINLLDFYINRGDVDTGLEKMTSYINDKYGNVHKNDAVLFKMGMTYFDVKRDYTSALRYFQQVDEKEIPDAKYYKSLAATMGTLNINYKKFAGDLLEFQKFNDSLPNNAKKIENYNSLANIYISYKSQISEANTEAIDIVLKAGDILEQLGQEELQFRYEMEFEQKLAQAYYSRAVNSEDKLTARDDYELAVEHYSKLIELNAPNQEEILGNIGVIHQEMGESSQAVEQFQTAIKKLPDSINIHVKLGNLLLDIEQSKEESKRNYKEAKQLYQKAGKLKGAREDEAFKKLTRRMENLRIL
ncbi:protein kinase domain-containing protein [Mesobacillus foraminis]|uniref:non-specific serine/threonine protein kinase n=1 Tax=Mesobacillus foraminis TaxID=279826 RepID=A0A4R2BE25_9BACI|nr:protein kinase [Mesobacillus foraminis]TCN24109.1 serine/threonine-protein kinase [Mesobacillus foraminis]